MIQLSLNGLAIYMTSSPSKQRKLLRDFKFPDPEGFARAKYYKEAKYIIKNYHKYKHDIDWLFDNAEEIENPGGYLTKSQKKRLENNAKVIKSYGKHFGDKEFEIKENVDLDLQIGNVLITVNPELHVIENKKEKFIKLDFLKNPHEDLFIKIVCQVLFETVIKKYSIPSSGVLYFDVLRGKTFRGARMGSIIKKDIETTCENIEAIWPKIKK